MNSVSIFVVILALVIVNGAFIPQESSSYRFRTISINLASSEGDTVLYSDNDADDSKKFSKNKRWSSLNPSVKQRIIKEGQERAIRNKKKREPAADKKRRMLMQYKKAMVENKKSLKIMRPLAPNSKDRTKLVDIAIGNVYNGTVISLTDFGAYVDVGSECDGLLHVSQITRDVFVEHPRQALSPGDLIDVRITKVHTGMKKMQLTMLPEHVLEDEDEDEEEFEERIPLTDLALDDELWGEIKRVTSYGAYVELGAVRQGWLHFMDHPEFEYGSKPHDLMSVGDRIRCWVSNVDTDLQRIKLTANRPNDLPGPRREMKIMSDDDYY
uniref:S1 motif domain-containing protein n=1 Tax=Chaetoceros debilis TaxID=122233 RepID=A0A7S3QJ39_9STRA